MLYPVLRSGYMFDDIVNYACEGFCINNDMNIFQMCVLFAKNWISKGRFFPLSTLGYIVFYVLNNVVIYKLYIVILIFTVGILISEICYFVTESQRIRYYCVALYPILVSLDCSYHTAIYSYNGLLQSICICVFSAILLFIEYSKRKKIRYRIFGCILLSISFMTYELSFGLCLIFGAVSFHIYKNYKTAFLKILPEFITGSFFLLINFIVKILNKSGYDGINFYLGKNSIVVFFKQLTGSSSIGNWYLRCSRRNSRGSIRIVFYR